MKCSEICIYIVPFFADFWFKINWIEINNIQKQPPEVFC